MLQDRIDDNNLNGELKLRGNGYVVRTDRALLARFCTREALERPGCIIDLPGTATRHVTETFLRGMHAHASETAGEGYDFSASSTHLEENEDKLAFVNLVHELAVCDDALLNSLVRVVFETVCGEFADCHVASEGYVREVARRVRVMPDSSPWRGIVEVIAMRILRRIIGNRLKAVRDLGALEQVFLAIPASTSGDDDDESDDSDLQ